MGRGDDGLLSFAVPTVNGEVQRYFRDRSSAIRVPRRLSQLRSSIYDAAAELGQRHGRAPRPSEIAELLGMEVEPVLEGLQAFGAGYTTSLDEPAYWNEEGSGERTRFEAATGRVEPEFDLVEHRESLAPLLAALRARADDPPAAVLRRPHQSEIGDRVGVSQMHVSRLLTRTLHQLRVGLAS